MRHGDISNVRGYVFGFRCEGSLLKYRDDGIVDFALNFMFGKSHRAEIDQRILGYMRHIYERTEHTVSLVVDRRNYTDELRSFLEDMNVPYNQVGLVVNRYTEITSMLNSGELSFYVDSDYNRRMLVNSQYAVDADGLDTIIRRRV